MQPIDNSTRIPEPIQSNVKQFIDNNPNATKLEIAQYGYNIAQVFVKELEKQINHNQK